MSDVPVCAGRGTQAPCRHYRLTDKGMHACEALYNVVTGEALTRFCEDVRGDQNTCGRRGLLYEAVEATGRFWVKKVERHA